MLEGEGGKVGALDVSTFNYVLPEFDDLDGDADVNILFHKDGVKGYVIEETGEFVPKDKFEEDEKYDTAYVYNTFLPWKKIISSNPESFNYNLFQHDY